MQVGLESPLDLQVQQETMSVPQQRQQMQVGSEPPPGLQVQGEAMSSVTPRQSLSTQAEEVRPQYELQLQPGDASETHISQKPQQKSHIQVGVMSQPRLQEQSTKGLGTPSSGETTLSEPQPSLQFEELVHRHGSTAHSLTNSPQSKPYCQ